MAAPTQTFTLNDPGLGTVTPATSVACVYGVSSLGTNNVLKSYSSINDLRAGQGEGEAVETAARILAIAGGPVRFMKSANSVASANGSVTATRVGTSTGTITVAGTPNDDYQFQISIKSTGDKGVARFAYSMDSGRTFSETLTSPSGGVYVVANTGITITFVSGAGPTFFETGDLHTWSSTAAMWNATDLAAGVTALLADPTTWDFLVLAGKHATASAANTILAALDTHMTNFANQFRFVRAMMDGGADTDATTISAFTNTSRRVTVCYGTCNVASSKPFAGWATPTLPIVTVVASEAARNLISTDLARFANGSLSGVSAIGYDEFLKATMDDQKFTTLRTFQGVSGFYVTNCRLKSPTGSDFRYWQHGRVIDAACSTAYKAQLRWQSSSLRVSSDKTILPQDAARVETDVGGKLESVLSTPKNVEGTPGHVSADINKGDKGFAYRVSRTEPSLDTETLAADIAVRPLFYPKMIKVQIGFATNLVAA